MALDLSQDHQFDYEHDDRHVGSNDDVDCHIGSNAQDASMEGLGKVESQNDVDLVEMQDFNMWITRVTFIETTFLNLNAVSQHSHSTCLHTFTQQFALNSLDAPTLSVSTEGLAQAVKT